MTKSVYELMSKDLTDICRKAGIIKSNQEVTWRYQTEIQTGGVCFYNIKVDGSAGAPTNIHVWKDDKGDILAKKMK